MPLCLLERVRRGRRTHARGHIRLRRERVERTDPVAGVRRPVEDEAVQASGRRVLGLVGHELVQVLIVPAIVREVPVLPDARLLLVAETAHAREARLCAGGRVDLPHPAGAQLGIVEERELLVRRVGLHGVRAISTCRGCPW